MNSVQLVGRLGADPEMKYTTSGKAVCSLRVATDGFAGGEKTTEWHRVTCWEKQAETANQYLSKGSEVAVEGRLQTRKWQDQEGKDRYTTEIVAHRIGFIGGKREGGGEPRQQQAPKPTAEPAGGDLDDRIPFAQHERGSIV